MRIRARLAVPAVGIATLFAFAVSADASPVCTGTAEDGYVCVEPDNAPSADTTPGSWVGRCVLLPGATQCQNIGTTVPGVSIDFGRPTQVVYCSGNCGTTAVNLVTGAAAPAVDYARGVAGEAQEIAEDVEDQHDWCLNGTNVQALVSYTTCMIGS